MLRILCRTALALSLSFALSTLAVAEQSQLGTVDFPNSGAEEAQEPFVRGILLLHSFEFEDAREAFEEALAIDPDFYLAYWGAAMTHNHPLWAQQDRDAALAVLATLAPTPTERLAKAPSERERGYFEALEVLYGQDDSGLGKAERDIAYSEAMAGLSRRYPDDLEAKAFYALSILGSLPERNFRTYMQAAAIAEEVFAANPNHPGAAHYLIHSYDDPIHAPLGLRAARVYAGIAPAATHAQHMISHIYTALGRWDEVIAANQKAFAVSEERLRRKGQPNHGRTKHSLHWLEHGLLQEGRVAEAQETIEIITTDTDADPNRGHLWYYAQMRASYVVANPRAAGAPATRDLPEASIDAIAVDAFATALQASVRGDLTGVRKAGNALEKALSATEVTPADEGRNAYQGAVSPADIEVARILSQEIEALALYAEGKVDAALAILEQATAAEEARALEYGPPSVVKPSHELLGEMLLAQDRPAEARIQFEKALERAPRRALSLRGLALAAEAAGQPIAAREASATLDEFWQGGPERLEQRPGTFSD